MNINAARDVLETIKKYEKIIIFRHFRPDGDAVGSTKGLKRILELSFPEKEVILQNCDFSDYLSFLGAEDAMRDDEYYKDALGIVVDTATAARVSNQKFSLCREVILNGVGGKDTRFFIDNFEDQLIGLNVGDTKDVLVKAIEFAPLESGNLVFGYYSQWNFYGYTEKMLETCDVINLCFGYVTPEFTIDATSVYPVLSQVLVAREHGVRVVLSIQGYSSAGTNFSRAAATEQGRITLAESMLRVVEKYHLDGIDIDWEYPESWQEWEQLGYFIADLREELSGSCISISIASSVGYRTPNYWTTDQLDFIMTMSYDDLTPDNHASMRLFQRDGNMCLNNFHMPKPKIVIGLPFYSNEKGKLTSQYGYSQIIGWYPNIKPGENTFQSKKKDGSPGPMHSFNGPVLIAEKCRWMKQEKFGGVMIWAYDTDVKLSHRASLGKAMYKVIKQSK